jgi:hypothetical protein
MANIEHIEAQPEGHPGLLAFLYLLAAGVAGTICAFSPFAHFVLPIVPRIGG